jgi:CDP-diacylglycerol--glycerol-3-phosphate 3-phosphatidyltransferase
VVAVAVPGVAALGGRWRVVGAALVVVSAVLDGLDGAVARATGTATDRGRTLDHVADRTSDLALLVSLGLLGGSAWAPPALAVAGATTLAQESVRARSGPLGLTVAERPTRVVLAAMVLLGAGVTPASAPRTAAAGAGGAAVLGVVGLGQVLRMRRACR